MKTLFFATLFFCCTFAGFARQSKSDDWKQQGRHQVGVSWGIAPLGPLEYNFPGAVGDKVREDDSNTGAISAYYLYRASKVIAVGASYIYTGVKGHSNTLLQQTGNFHYKSRSHTILPQMQVNWLNRKRVTLYSRVGVGVRFEADAKTSNDSGAQTRSTTGYFAFQLSPIGIEVGRKFAGFAEIGLGTLGVGIVGVRYRF